MIIKKLTALSVVLLLVTGFGCKSKNKIKQQDDELYSRHLQRQVKLTIISTPMPHDKTTLNLLILNDGQELGQFRVKEVIDSLYKNNLIKPLLVVAVHAGDRAKEYGVADYPDYFKRGDKANHYDAFINNELYPFIKKNATVRKFSSVAIAGCSQGGLSAFDIAWNRADKIDKVGVFSGAFSIADKSTENPDYSDETDRIMLNKIKASRKKSNLKFWFYGDDEQENGMRYHDSISINHSKDLIAIIKKKNISPPEDIVYTNKTKAEEGYYAWSKQLPAFLIWAFGK